MTYSERAIEYCNDVISGKILAGRKIKFACLRHLNDLENSKLEDYPYKYEVKRADRVCRFAERLTHVDGRWAGKPFLLAPYQIFMTCCIFGWLKKKNNFRRFTQVYACIPRKSGKSAWSATLGLYCLLEDGENGAQIFSGATTEKQALEVFRVAFRMAKASPELIDYYGLSFGGTLINPTSIYKVSDLSRFEPIVGNPGDGSSPSFAICDEVHEHKTSAMMDTMSTGMGARTQGCLFCITTAGTDLSSPCYDMHIEAIKILEGSKQKDYEFCIIFDADEEDDYQDFNTWIKANPGYGISVNEDYLRMKYDECVNTISKRNINQCKHLNRWSSISTAWMDMIKWNACKDTTLHLNDFLGRECFVAMDLANKIDLCAVILLFKHRKNVIHVNCPKCQSDVTLKNGVNVCGDLECGWSKEVAVDGFVVFGKYYLNEERIMKKENQHYRDWVAEGKMIMTDGAMTDFHRIEDDLRELSAQFIFRELSFDQRDASYLVQNVTTWANFECIEFPQSPNLISEPMKTLEAKVYANEIWFDGDPVLTWNMSNVLKKEARGGGTTKHYFPTKQNDASKIDAAVSLIMALGRAITYEDDGDSYNSRAKAGIEEILRVI